MATAHGTAGIVRQASRGHAAPPKAVEGSHKKICFIFNAQLHHVPHGLATAAELAKEADLAVDIRVASQAHIDFIAPRLPGGDAGLSVSLFGSPLLRAFGRLTGTTVPPKLLTLIAARRQLAGYDAIVLPERTSLLLRRLGVERPRFIHIDHGAGDGAAGFDSRIRHFDFVLLAGDKQRRRMLDEGLIREGGYATVGYPKFDAVDAVRDPFWTPFAEAKPVILYNPHFSKRLGSWPRFGLDLVHRILTTGRYNLVVAPHIRLFDGRLARARATAALRPFIGHPHLHVDLGSARSVDMSYTGMADIYVGDVSSQVYEFLRRPRPCLFLNGHGAAWRGDHNYDHWRFGPVLGSLDALVPALDAARETHAFYRGAQEAAFRDTFDLTGQLSHRRAAEAISAYLRGGAESGY